MISTSSAVISISLISLIGWVLFHRGSGRLDLLYAQVGGFNPGDIGGPRTSEGTGTRLKEASN